jgi:hypothetical protein
MDANFGDATFDPYHTVNVYQPRRHLATVSIHTMSMGLSSEVDYSGASGFSTPASDLDLFNDNASLDWDSSLASFFDLVEATALGSGSSPSFLESNDMNSC